MNVPQDELSIDFMILADRAEALNGKLYVMGGAWDQTFVQDIKQPLKISLALAVLVPWDETNRQHTLTITLEDAEGNLVGFRMDAQFTAARPPSSSLGDVQRMILALPDIPLLLPRLGDYRMVAHLNGIAAKKTPFKVSSAAPQATSRVPASSQP